jgi:hypothetical protein
MIHKMLQTCSIGNVLAMVGVEGQCRCKFFSRANICMHKRNLTIAEGEAIIILEAIRVATLEDDPRFSLKVIPWLW